MTVVGYRTTTFPGFYVADSGSTARLVGRRPGSRPPPVFAARRALAPGRRRGGQPAAGGRAARPGAARPGDRRRAGRRRARPACAARTSPRSCSTTCTGPARARRLAVNVRARAAQRRAGRADRRRARRAGRRLTGGPRVVVVGDVATDVVVVLAGTPAPGSDRPAAIRTRGGGAGANVAVAPGPARASPVVLAGCVGDDPAGRGAGRRAGRGRGAPGAAGGPRRADRHDREPGRARR